MKKLLLIIFPLVLFSCKKDKPKEALFQRYINSVESVALPISFYSQGELETISDGYLEAGFKKYKQAWATKPYGKAFVSDAFIAVVEIVPGDVLVPVVATYSLSGAKIDSLNPFMGGGFDMGYQATVLATIQPDFSVTIVDSIRKWDLNEEGDNIVLGSDKLTLKKSRYIISKEGKFLKR